MTSNVKSLFGVTSKGSLNTLVSMPRLGIETVGVNPNGPRRTRTVAGSGPPSAVMVWANEAGATSSATERAQKIWRFKEMYTNS